MLMKFWKDNLNILHKYDQSVSLDNLVCLDVNEINYFYYKNNAAY